METLTFNFGNEANIITCTKHDDGTITIPAVTNSPVFNSMEELAQNYAQARGVKPENFKNWVLSEDNTCFSYVLRAGTAGVSASEIATAMNATFETLRASGTISTLDMNSIASLLRNSANVEETLTSMNVQYPHLATGINAVYMALTEAGCFNVVEEAVEIDNRSAIEKFLDYEMERRGTLAVVALTLGISVTATKEECMGAFATTFGDNPQAFDRFDIAYEAICKTSATYETDTIEKAVLVLSQAAIGAPDEEAKSKLATMATLASRTSVNIPLLRVGHTGVITSAEYITLEELATLDIYKVDNITAIIRFDETVDAELAERRTENEVDEDYEDYDDYVRFVDDEDEDEDDEER